MPTTPKLRIFLSFSGPVSKAVGAALFEWLKTLSPSFAPFMSDRDISAGSWSPQLMKALRTSDACIACLTRENLDAEWIHFEAGAIAMRDRYERLALFGLDLNPGELRQPLSASQLCSADLIGVQKLSKLLISRMKSLAIPIPAGFPKFIENSYPALEERLNGIRDKFGIDPLVPSRIRAGLGVNYQEMIDATTQEIILAGQNLLGPIGRGTFHTFIVNLIKSRPKFRALFLLAVPEFFDCLTKSPEQRQVYRQQYLVTLRNLKESRDSLNEEERLRFRVFAHPGASSLTAFFRDPEDEKRGLVAISPKWATDQTPGSRLACVIKRAENKDLFLSLYGHIGIMDDASHSQSLEQLLLAAGEKP